jgi:hypothetical protein
VLAPPDSPLYAGPVAFDDDGQPLWAVEYIVDDAILDGHDYTSLYVKYNGYNIPSLTCAISTPCLTRTTPPWQSTK